VKDRRDGKKLEGAAHREPLVRAMLDSISAPGIHGRNPKASTEPAFDRTDARLGRLRPCNWLLRPARRKREQDEAGTEELPKRTP